MTQRFPHAWRPLRRSSNGAIDRPLAIDHWLVPAVLEIRNYRRQPSGGAPGQREPFLAWKTFLLTRHQPKRFAREPRRVRAPQELLEAFLRLDSAPDAQIHRFARRWGVLDLCKDHRLPCSHYPSWSGFLNGPHWIGCQPAGLDRWDGVEALAEWRDFARRARGLLDVAASIHAGRVGASADWQAAFTGWREPAPWWKQSPSTDRLVLVDLLNHWLQFGGVQPRLRWGNTRTIEFGGAGLAGALALQLVLAVGQTGGVALCSGCGRSYAPKKQPAANRRRYCPSCQQRGIPLRDAQRARRARLQGDRL